MQNLFVNGYKIILYYRKILNSFTLDTCIIINLRIRNFIFKRGFKYFKASIINIKNIDKMKRSIFCIF